MQKAQARLEELKAQLATVDKKRLSIVAEIDKVNSAMEVFQELKQNRS